ncbi:MAG: hypothetical protein OES28_06755, partial [Desulfobulbaceae bacterium]|nr:hypothetical protein [Desulfobulbaceae bacterium]
FAAFDRQCPAADFGLNFFIHVFSFWFVSAASAAIPCPWQESYSPQPDMFYCEHPPPARIPSNRPDNPGRKRSFLSPKA